jgi:hypothetical protein
MIVHLDAATRSLDSRKDHTVAGEADPLAGEAPAYNQRRCRFDAFWLGPPETPLRRALPKTFPVFVVS